MTFLSIYNLYYSLFHCSSTSKFQSQPKIQDLLPCHCCNDFSTPELDESPESVIILIVHRRLASFRNKTNFLSFNWRRKYIILPNCVLGQPMNQHPYQLVVYLCQSEGSFGYKSTLKSNKGDSNFSRTHQIALQNLDKSIFKDLTTLTERSWTALSFKVSLEQNYKNLKQFIATQLSSSMSVVWVLAEHLFWLTFIWECSYSMGAHYGNNLVTECDK